MVAGWARRSEMDDVFQLVALEMWLAGTEHGVRVCEPREPCCLAGCLGIPVGGIWSAGGQA